jgi:hypothetical protein
LHTCKSTHIKRKSNRFFSHKIRRFKVKVLHLDGHGRNDFEADDDVSEYGSIDEDSLHRRGADFVGGLVGPGDKAEKDVLYAGTGEKTTSEKEDF